MYMAAVCRHAQRRPGRFPYSSPCCGMFRLSDMSGVKLRAQTGDALSSAAGSSAIVNRLAWSSIQLAIPVRTESMPHKSASQQLQPRSRLDWRKMPGEGSEKVSPARGRCLPRVGTTLLEAFLRRQRRLVRLEMILTASYMSCLARASSGAGKLSARRSSGCISKLSPLGAAPLSTCWPGDDLWYTCMRAPGRGKLRHLCPTASSKVQRALSRETSHLRRPSRRRTRFLLVP
jgi:hypothetical protein